MRLWLAQQLLLNGENMPIVGKGKAAKHFVYTKKGKKAAKAYAKKRRMKVAY